MNYPYNSVTGRGYIGKITPKSGIIRLEGKKWLPPDSELKLMKHCR
ncbi:hypothetical protein [Laspinema olomoucense]|uniref:Uncharacterized protein n=1 Tax=Laspinema olomoucense D3b TaxID=2953688 RepID=A0ABT2NBV0_9CYAN|nr:MULTISPECIES: hypothetical protein [unclassified Laspinema]MCT7973197.1 hypothetical protein [Laspinema sp. D3d]MCT7978741.1 hypothetical protein [Laspinema sp. D3b]